VLVTPVAGVVAVAAEDAAEVELFVDAIIILLGIIVVGIVVSGDGMVACSAESA